MSVDVHCRTNLDVDAERWPRILPFRPNVGDSIESSVVYDGCGSLRLKVVAVTFLCHDGDNWEAEVELHLPDHFQTISDFKEWYGKLRGSPLYG